MAWTAPPTFTNAVLTAAQMNIISSDLRETAAGRATTAGSMFIGTGVNSLVERVPQQNYNFAIETTTSTTYVDLATVGPSVTVTTGPTAILFLSSIIHNNTTGAYSCISMSVYTPPSTVYYAPDDNYALIIKSEASTGGITGAGTRAHLFSGLVSQSNLFRGKYRVSAGTGTYDERGLIVIPL
jgi:hypothetical protein